MSLLGLYLAASGLLVVAGLAKVARPGDTGRALAALFPGGPPLRGWLVAVRVLAGAEAALGAAALVVPGRPLALAVAGSYLAFTVFVFAARSAGGALATCGCFGSPDTPPTATHAAVTLVLAAGAVAVAVAAPTGTVGHLLAAQVADGVPLIAASGVVGFLAWAVMSPLARLGALRAMTPR